MQHKPFNAVKIGDTVYILSNSNNLELLTVDDIKLITTDTNRNKLWIKYSNGKRSIVEFFDTCDKSINNTIIYLSKNDALIELHNRKIKIDETIDKLIKV